ncbi:MAG TPA: DUF5678 domain-containing protein [Candidatus Binatia bacterium]|jgi:hypothetical protein
MRKSKREKTARVRQRASIQTPYSDPDDRYFKKHFGQLVREHGGKWIVLADGELIGIAEKKQIAKLVEKAQSNHPNAAPFIAPIPTKEDLECVL